LLLVVFVVAELKHHAGNPTSVTSAAGSRRETSRIRASSAAQIFPIEVLPDHLPIVVGDAVVEEPELAGFDDRLHPRASRLAEHPQGRRELLVIMRVYVDDCPANGVRI
jgi:hypothetical protein